MTNLPWLTPAYIKTNSIIEKNVDDLKVTRAILAAQNFKIQSLLGDVWFNALAAKRTDELTWTGLTSAETIMIDSYLNPVLLHYAVMEYLVVGNFSISAQGIEKRASDNSVNADQAEVGYLIRNAQDKAQFASTLLVKYLCEHSTDFPLYTNSTGALLHPKTKNSGYGSDTFSSM